jgi:hypothetical protein
MRLSVGKIERNGVLDNKSDQALTASQPRIVHSRGRKPFRREKLQHAAAAPQIYGADFGHHIGGNDGYELVEAILRTRLLRHDLAQAAE